MAPYEALYGRRCRSPICWNEVGERKLLGLELVQVTTEKIRLIKERLLTAHSRQKSYADKRRCDLEFQVGDYVFLKVSPWKGVFRFGKKGKLSPRFIGPFEVLQRIGQASILLATDVASHDSDISTVDLVINYDNQESERLCSSSGKYRKSRQRWVICELRFPKEFECKEQEVLSDIKRIFNASRVAKMKLMDEGFDEKAKERKEQKMKTLAEKGLLKKRNKKRKIYVD
ncbi:hypothetical protein LWI28_026169 [Acer negundo]|uniref:Tf2-1-like SH3-like domain-containing protein n=1 Tax=Acer negundo TaxID=4023 RepID=A0AAD5NJ15_ACENE|nr:hypothetical protein LWI28_026169 [Acer negundo]